MNIKISLTIIIHFFIISELYGSTYYVAPFGNDSYTKTQAQSSNTPWRTISKAVQEVQAGDSIIVADGEYIEGPITFTSSGDASHWITLTSAPGANPIITKSGVLRGIHIRYCSYIHINGFTLHGYDNDGISIFWSDHIICTNIHAYDNGDAGILTVDSNYLLIRDCVLHHNGWNPSSGWGDGLTINNHGAKGMISIVQRNICYANWQMNGSHGDGNGFTLDQAGTDGVHLVANNIFFNNGGDGLLATYTSNIRIVHNVIFRNGSDPEDETKVELMLARKEASNSIFKNNIIYSRLNGWAVYRYDGTDNASIFNNCIWGGLGLNTKIYWFKGTTLEKWVETRAPNTLAGDAGFVSVYNDDNYITFHGKRWIDMDIKNYNFELQSSSQCIDGGTFLTTTTNTASGTEIRVADAGYFTDGFGQTDGDLIQVGVNKPVRITHIDYSNNLITVKSSINWNNGDGVSLPYDDSAPDIGAYECRNVDLTASISLSDPSPTKAGEVKVTLTTTKRVVKIPTPLFFTESDNSITEINLDGSIPGTTFEGIFNVNNTIADGLGHFSLPIYALEDERGNTSNNIIAGSDVIVDQTTPNSPLNLIIRPHAVPKK